MSLKAAERTISAGDLEDQSPKRNFMRDSIADPAYKSMKIHEEERNYETDL